MAFFIKWGVPRRMSEIRTWTGTTGVQPRGKEREDTYHATGHRINYWYGFGFSNKWLLSLFVFDKPQSGKFPYIPVFTWRGQEREGCNNPNGSERELKARVAQLEEALKPFATPWPHRRTLKGEDFKRAERCFLPTEDKDTSETDLF